MPRFLAAALVLLLLGGCDRFADEARLLAIVVQDAEGRPLSNVEVHAVLHFQPRFPRETSLPVQFMLDRLTGVTFTVERRSDGASVPGGDLGILGPGRHTLPPTAFALPNGVYRVRVRGGNEVLLDTDVVLNRAPDAAGTIPPHGRALGGQQVLLDADDLSLGAVAHLDQSGRVEPFTVTDSLTLWFARAGTKPEALAVRLNAVGTTRVVARLQ